MLLLKVTGPREEQHGARRVQKVLPASWHRPRCVPVHATWADGSQHVAGNTDEVSHCVPVGKYGDSAGATVCTNCVAGMKQHVLD